LDAVPDDAEGGPGEREVSDGEPQPEGRSQPELRLPTGLPYVDDRGRVAWSLLRDDLEAVGSFVGMVVFCCLGIYVVWTLAHEYGPQLASSPWTPDGVDRFLLDIAETPWPDWLPTLPGWLSWLLLWWWAIFVAAIAFLLIGTPDGRQEIRDLITGADGGRARWQVSGLLLVFPFMALVALAVGLFAWFILRDFL